MLGKHNNNKLWKAISLVSAVSVSAVMAGCSSSESTSARTTSSANTGSVSVTVDPAKLNISLSAGSSLVTPPQTNRAGYVRLSSLAASDRLVLNLIDQTYSNAPQYFVTNIQTAESINFGNIKITSLTENTGTNAPTFVVSNGADVTNDKGAKVLLNPNAFTLNSAFANRSFRLYLESLDISNKLLQYIPGDAKTSVNGTLTSLEAFSVVYFNILDNENVRSSIATFLNDNESVQISLPVTGSMLDSTMDLYYFDTSDGLWKVDSQLTLNAEKTAYTGTTRRIGFYLGAMKPVTDTVTLTGCVESVTTDESGQKTYSKLSRSLIKLLGQSYNGYNQAMTDADGNYSITAKTGSDVKLIYRKGQFSSEQTLSNINTDTQVPGTAESPNGCTVIDVNVNTKTVSGSLTWTGAKDYDINVMLPSRVVMTYANRTINNNDTSVNEGVGIQIVENPAGNAETITYTPPMVGSQLLAVNNFNNNYTPPMTTSGTRFVIDGRTFTPPTGEISERDSPLVDRRTNIWIAAIMQVENDCTVTLQTPEEYNATVSDDNKIKPWVTDTQFYRGNVFMNEDLVYSGTEGMTSATDDPSNPLQTGTFCTPTATP